MSRWYKDRPPPFGNKITFGESIFYEHSDGHWYNEETHERCEVTTLEEIFEKIETENETKRKKANK